MVVGRLSEEADDLSFLALGPGVGSDLTEGEEEVATRFERVLDDDDDDDEEDPDRVFVAEDDVVDEDEL